MVDIPGNSTTTATISVGGTTSDTLELVGDHDWFRIDLTAGQSISVLLDGISLEDSYLTIRDSSGNVLFENDDINPGIVRDSKLAFTAGYTGTYYIDVGAWEDDYAGTYQLSVSTYTPPPVASIDDIADQLVNGYWGGDDHHFNVTQGGSITVNLTGLTAAGRTLAVAALRTWTDIIGVNFVQVTSGGQIVFDDEDDGAFSDSNWSNGIITSSHVNVSTQWLADYGTGLNTYSYQTYIHEIGHALGLGHAGNYNGEASFPYDALFLNDGWPVSVMSYFSQTDSSYYSGQGFDENFLVTPMLADILAMSALYGLSTATRTGNTTYGFNSNAGNDIYNANLYPNVAYTIYDSGGTDTLDYSGFGNDQLINLNPETFSNVGTNVGNVTIARGVVIENAIGGAGWDTLIGNSANNLLDGGGGTVNTISYATAAGAVTIDTSITSAQNTGGAGVDTLLNYQILIGSAFNDTLTGRNGTELQQVQLSGGDGNDTLIASSDGDTMYGDSGDDTLQGGASRDILEGGSGADTLTGAGGDDTLYGGEGNDILDSGAGADGMAGGLGNDSYVVDNAGDSLLEYSDGGTDTVLASISHSLGLFIENLTLTGAAAIDGTGNSMANIIEGNGSANVLDGGWDNDTLLGNGGNDALNGGSDDDLLDGGTGADSMAGGLGDDILVVDDAGDTTIEAAGEGADTVQSSISRALGANLENLTLTGSAAVNGTGNSLANVITGNGGANVLDGGAGADQMAGGLGDDIYYVDQAGDVVIEADGEGTDEIRTSLAYVLGSNLENLRLSGSGAVAGTGNALANTIRGNDAANLLSGLDGADKLYGNGGDDMVDGGSGDDYLYGLIGNDSLTGGAGYDRMYGGVGDDTYYANDADDYAYENEGEGIDQVIASIDHQLRAHVENLTLAGSAFIGKGNELGNQINGTANANKLYGYGGDDQLNGGGGDDYLFGAEGNDALTGGAGYDRMYGGTGDDSYYVNDSTDHAYENAGEGYDQVIATINHVLRANVEELELGGTADLRGWGNAENNLVVGNSGNNLLYGRDGSDSLRGNAGNDILYGENGDDVLVGATGQDRYYGGAGADDFIFADGDFAGLGSATAERIHDFSQAQGDQIVLTDVDANSLIGGDQAFAFMGTAAFTGVAGQLRTYQSSGNTYVQGDTNGDGVADFLIRLDGLHTLQASDFLV